MLYSTVERIKGRVQLPRTSKYSRRQRQKQLPRLVNLGVEEQVKISLHSSDVYRCIRRSVVFELLPVSGLRGIELALRIDTSKESNSVVHEMWDAACIPAQEGKRTREVDELVAG